MSDVLHHTATEEVLLDQNEI